MDIKQKIRLFTLENAVKFKGKANPGAVIGKILSEDPGLKKDMKSLSSQINEVVKEVNSLSHDEQKKEFDSVKPKFQSIEKPKHQKKKELPDLQGAEYGKVITRLPPEPSKYNHIGHALSFLINYTYAKKYNGKCYLKFEDTNPEKCTQEFADAMIEDLTQYLEIKPDKIIFISDEMDYMYEQAEILIGKKKAYACFCDRETMQDKRHKGIECKCRKTSTKDNISHWKKMLEKKYKEEECILRLKADMSAQNQAMRDPVLFRITYAEHFRHKNKYCTWPLYDFENSVMDCKYKVTHILRSIEFGTMRAEVQDFIKDSLGFEKQIVKEYGRFNIKGAISQGREIRQLIEEKKVIGWDDPSLVTLKALKRRGIVKETLYELMYEAGLSPSSTKNIDWTVISAINRSILDPNVSRYFFINEPVKIDIEDAPEQKLELKLHPDHPERGKRKFRTSNLFYVSKEDYDKFKPGELIRLMDCLNFKISGKKFLFDSKEHEKYKGKGKMIIHWLPVSDNLVKAQIRMPDNKIIEGLTEDSIKEISEGDIIQFTRFGFCRLDKKEKDKLEFWFTTK